MALKAHGVDGVPQVQLYDPGVGTEYGVKDFVIGGAFGNGIDLNIKQLYAFLSLNYAPGDEVFLFGYSRGAYTIRSLVGLVNTAGLVRRNHVRFIDDAYALYRRNPGADSPEASAFRDQHGESISIALVACFDTVGALGIPNIFPDAVNRMINRHYSFHDTVISANVKLAVQALSIDEWKGAFQPTLMIPHDDKTPDQVVQFFCWGDHEGVGGGNKKKAQSSYCSLDAVVSAMRDRGIPLAFDDSLFPAYDLNVPTAMVYDKIDIMERVFFGIANILTGSGIRKIPSVSVVHVTALQRYMQVPDWRPEALRPLHNDILNSKIADKFRR